MAKSGCMFRRRKNGRVSAVWENHVNVKLTLVRDAVYAESLVHVAGKLRRCRGPFASRANC